MISPFDDAQMHSARFTTPDLKVLVTIFNELFVPTWRTCLVGGAAEPLYSPAQGDHLLHRVIFTRDYFSSALHEIAHWCIAGPQRLHLEDYGYWYAADGRSAQQQAIFEQVEVKPQALEWIFSVASGVRFQVSADNLSAAIGPSPAFKCRIHEQVLRYLADGVNQRAYQLICALHQATGSKNPWDPAHYDLAQLR